MLHNAFRYLAAGSALFFAVWEWAGKYDTHSVVVGLLWCALGLSVLIPTLQAVNDDK